MNKLLLSDLDGTLIDDQNIINDNDLKAIKFWQQHSTFMVASGRYYTDIINLLNNYNLQAGMVALNGAIVLNKNQQIVLKNPITNINFIKRIIYFCEQHQIIYIVYGLHKVWSRLYPELLLTQLKQLGKKRSGNKNQIIKYMHQYYQEIYQQFNVITAPFNQFNETVLHIELFDVRDELFKKLKLEYKNKLMITTASPVDLEISSLNVDKGIILKMFQQQYDSIIAIGDGNNDVLMLKNANIGIAMANGTSIIKKQADFITTDNNHCGVANAIEKLIDDYHIFNT